MPAQKDTKVLADLTFTSIQEDYRLYIFIGETTLRIEKPRWLHVKRKPEGDSHRIIDASGVSHYIAPGWLAFSFKAPEGEEFGL